MSYIKSIIGLDCNPGESILLEGSYTPKFSSGTDLRTCARLYGLSVKDKLAVIDPTAIAEELNDEDEEGGVD